MGRFSKVDFAPDTEASILYYNDIDLTVYFNENDVVHEFQFGENYEGITSTGIRIGDSLEKAIQILKQPKMRSATGAIWDHFAVFCRNYRIISMRVK